MMRQIFYCLMRAGVLAVGLVLAAPLYAQMGSGMGGGMGGGMMGGQGSTGSGMMGGQQGMGSVPQQRSGAPNQQTDSERDAQQMSGVMRDMADRLMALSRQMSKGEMTAATRQRTQEQMWEMAMMIERLSDMMGKDIASHPDMQRQMDEIRQRMQEMRKAAR